MSDTLVFFDLETGGLDPLRHPIIQIAAIAVDPSYKRLKKFERKLTFRTESATNEALALNSYDSETWAKHAVHPHEAFKDFRKFLITHASRTFYKKPVAELAGHNIVKFDMRFLSRYEEHLGIRLPVYPKVFDTLQLALWWDRITNAQLKSHNLKTLVEHFGIDLNDKAHDALVDVEATIAVASCIAHDLKDHIFLSKEANRQSILEDLEAQRKEDLEEETLERMRGL